MEAGKNKWQGTMVDPSHIFESHGKGESGVNKKSNTVS